MRLTYTVVFVLDANGWGAYSPDVPGCVSVGDTWEEMLEMTQEALTGHIELTVEDGDPLPEPKMSIEDAITYHLELADDDLGDLGLDFGDPPPTLATRFEPIEIEVRVPRTSPRSPRTCRGGMSVEFESSSPDWKAGPRIDPMKLTYAVVFERTSNNWCAYVPDVPGCVSVGDTWEEMLEMIDEGLTFHMEGTLEDGDSLPEPRMSIEDAIAYHLEPIPDDIMQSYLEFGDDTPSLATRFEFVEIEVQVPEPTQSSGASRSAPGTSTMTVRAPVRQPCLAPDSLPIHQR